MIYLILMKLQLPEVMVMMKLQLLQVMVMVQLQPLVVTVIMQLQLLLVMVMVKLQQLQVMVMVQLQPLVDKSSRKRSPWQACAKTAHGARRPPRQDADVNALSKAFPSHVVTFPCSSLLSP